MGALKNPFFELEKMKLQKVCVKTPIEVKREIKHNSAKHIKFKPGDKGTANYHCPILLPDNTVTQIARAIQHACTNASS